MLDMKSGILTGAKANLGFAGLSGPADTYRPALPTIRLRPHPVATPQLANDLAALQDRLHDLMPRLRVAVVYGGDKEKQGAVLYRAGNTRPWKSYLSVAEDLRQALREVGFRHVDLVADDMSMPATLQAKGAQLAWLNTGGVQGDNPVCHAAAQLEMLGVPYIGHNPLTSALLDEKDVFKRQLQALGVLTAPFVTWRPGDSVSLPERMRNTFGAYRGPFVVKPVSGRASLHVHKVDRPEDVAPLAAQVNALTHKPVLIEKFLSGREFCVAVCGPVVSRGGRLEKLDGPFAFSPLERKLEPGEAIFTSMDKKAITDDRAALVPAGPDGLRERLLDLARLIYRELDLTSLVRIDIRADEAGRLFVLEANPKPDLKRPGPGVTSLVAMGLPEQGMSYHDLVFGLLADRMRDLLVHNPARLEHVMSQVG
jgi:D-alanine-D-alanine ligase